MSSEDKAPLGPDLSVPPGTLDPGVWTQLIEQAFEMAPTELDASIVPDFDEYADIQLDEDTFDTPLDLGQDFELEGDTDDDLLIDDPALDAADNYGDDNYGAGDFGGDNYGAETDYGIDDSPLDPTDGFDDFL